MRIRVHLSPHPYRPHLPRDAGRWSALAATAEQRPALAMVGQVVTLWHECGKPFDSRTLARYYVSDLWKTSTLYKDLAALQRPRRF